MNKYIILICCLFVIGCGSNQKHEIYHCTIVDKTWGETIVGGKVPCLIVNVSGHAFQFGTTLDAYEAYQKGDKALIQVDDNGYISYIEKE